jgi:hypothetical protein
MEFITTTLSNEDIEGLDFLSEFYDEADRGLLMRLALRKFVNEHFAGDVSQEGEDADLKKICGE